jgi:hypothetical protein
MRLTLIVETGALKDRRYTFTPGQVVEVGRDESAVVAMPADLQMSRRHCSFTFEADAWKVIDRKSANGTLLNGARIVESNIEDGDAVTAGSTRFRVRLHALVDSEGQKAPSLAPSEPEAPPSPTVPTTIRRGPEEPTLTGTFAAEPCPSQFIRYYATSDEPSPAELVERLSRTCPLFLMIDPAKLGIAIPEAAKPAFLFDWLPDGAKASCSPVLMMASGKPKALELVAKGWGADAIVCLFSAEAPGSLLQHLRSIIRGQRAPNVPPPPGKVIGICWPSVLEQLLAHSRADFARFLMHGIEAIVLESTVPECRWQAFSGTGFESELTMLGLAPSGTGAAPAP